MYRTGKQDEFHEIAFEIEKNSIDSGAVVFETYLVKIKNNLSHINKTFFVACQNLKNSKISNL